MLKKYSSLCEKGFTIRWWHVNASVVLCLGNKILTFNLWKEKLCDNTFRPLNNTLTYILMYLFLSYAVLKDFILYIFYDNVLNES